METPPVPTPDTRALASSRPLAAGNDALEVQRALERTREELQRALADVRALRDSSDRFLASVSHELRTPLSAILLWTTLIEEEKLEDPQQLRDALDAIRRSAEEQQELIENLVDTTRLVTGRVRLDRRPIDIATVVRGALDTVRRAADEKSITLSASVQPVGATAPVDRTRLQQALVQLLDNAVRLTPEGGRVEVTARINPDELEIAVQDTGPGIAADLWPRLFAGPAEHQLKAPRIGAGLGYGLVVAHRIVTAHGGTLTASASQPLPGAVFSVRLPLSANRVILQAGPAAGTPAPLRGRHLLLVVHDQNVRERLAAALRDAGATVAEADSAPAASEAAERRRPDAILCDLSLPTIDAAALLREVRSIEREHGGERAPAIALAPDDPAGALADAANAGFERCASWRAEPAHLIAEVSAALGRAAE